MRKRNYPKVINAKSRNLSAGLNRLAGQSKLMSLYATFDRQTPDELKQSRKIGAHRMSKQQTRKRQCVPTEPKGFSKSAPMAPNSGRADVIKSRGERLLAGNTPTQHWSIGGDVFAVSTVGMPSW